MPTESARDLEAYLHTHIPLSAAMQVAVLSVSPDAVTPASVTLGAPLAPNINHRSTAFGGSISTLAILSAWALVNLRLKAEGLHSRLVIQSNRMDYDQPVEGDFTATATLADPGAWSHFVKMLTRKGRGRIVVQSAVRCGDIVGGHFEGEFVAFLNAPTP